MVGQPRDVEIQPGVVHQLSLSSLSLLLVPKKSGAAVRWKDRRVRLPSKASRHKTGAPHPGAVEKQRATLLIQLR